MKWVRPTLVVFMVIAVTIGFFVKYISSESFFGFATGLIVFWFKSRDTEKENGK